MRIAGRTLLEQWRPFKAGDLELGAELHAVKGEQNVNRRELFLVSPYYSPDHFERRPKEMTRISYEAFGEKGALFAGMAVAAEIRRSGIGKHLFDYFMEHIGEDGGRRLVGTGRIHKPIVALIVQRAGLVPNSTDCEAEILPPGSGADVEVPLVRFLRQDLPASEMKSSSLRFGPFYEVAAREAFTEVPVNQGRVVALHTGYRPVSPYEQMISAA